jgi:hypothetical protein
MNSLKSDECILKDDGTGEITIYVSIENVRCRSSIVEVCDRD